MKRITSLVILMLVGVTAAQAAPYTLDTNLVVHELKFTQLKEHPKMLWAGANGELGATPHYITVNSMSELRQYRVILFSPSDKSVKVDIVRDTWSDVANSCVSEANNRCDIDFRSAGDASFKITGDEGVKYQFVLLAGPEHPITENLSQPVYPVSKEKISQMNPEGGAVSQSSLNQQKSKSSGFQLIIIVLLVVLIIVVGLVAFALLKKKSSTNILIALLFIPPLLLSPIHSVLAGGNTLDDFSTKAGDEALKQVGTDIKALEDAKTLTNAWVKPCNAPAVFPGEPRIPSFCAGDEECHICYEKANTDFNKARAVLEKLRRIYTCTIDFSKAAIAFGDSSSGIHAVVGLVWQEERIGIVKSVDGLKSAVDKKFPQLMNGLHDAMMEQNQCEAKFGVPDWYDRFGHMYYEFIEDKYKRAD